MEAVSPGLLQVVPKIQHPPARPHTPLWDCVAGWSWLDTTPDTQSPAGIRTGNVLLPVGMLIPRGFWSSFKNLEGTKGVVTWKYKTSFPSFSTATSSAISSLGANWSQNNNYAGRDPKYTKREQGIAKLRSLTRICMCSSWRFSHSPVLLHTLSLLLPWQHLSPHPLTTPAPSSHQRWQGGHPGHRSVQNLSDSLQCKQALCQTGVSFPELHSVSQM